MLPVDRKLWLASVDCTNSHCFLIKDVSFDLSKAPSHQIQILTHTHTHTHTHWLSAYLAWYFERRSIAPGTWQHSPVPFEQGGGRRTLQGPTLRITFSKLFTLTPPFSVSTLSMITNTQLSTRQTIWIVKLTYGRILSTDINDNKYDSQQRRQVSLKGNYCWQRAKFNNATTVHFDLHIAGTRRLICTRNCAIYAQYFNLVAKFDRLSQFHKFITYIKMFIRRTATTNKRAAHKSDPNPTRFFLQVRLNNNPSDQAHACHSLYHILDFPHILSMNFSTCAFELHVPPISYRWFDHSSNI
jgi:hypothetical protein